jgi:hypothetical protein
VAAEVRYAQKYGGKQRIVQNSLHFGPDVMWLMVNRDILPYLIYARSISMMNG